MRVYHLFIPPSAVAAGVIRLHFASPTVTPPGDNRLLAVALDRFSLHPLSATGMPALPLLGSEVLLLGSLALLLWANRMPGWAFAPSVVAGAALIVTLNLGVVAGRAELRGGQVSLPCAGAPPLLPGTPRLPSDWRGTRPTLGTAERAGRGMAHLWADRVAGPRPVVLWGHHGGEEVASAADPLSQDFRLQICRLLAALRLCGFASDR